MLSANLPARFTSLEGTLLTAKVNGGLRCENAANQLIVSCLMRDEIVLMEEHIPGTLWQLWRPMMTGYITEKELQATVRELA